MLLSLRRSSSALLQRTPKQSCSCHIRIQRSKATASTMSAAVAAADAPRVSVAVVGDCHGLWGPADAAALQALQADAVLFVGDIGNEDVELVQQIAALDVQKAVIKGNHGAWYSLTSHGRQRQQRQTQSPPRTADILQPGLHQPPTQPPQPPPPDRVQQQLDALGADHVGYGHKALRDCNISIVGARPFSKGGKSWSSIADFMSQRFGVGSMQESAAKVLQVINSQVPADNALILLAHNGPLGLGGEPHNICGVDWLSEAGDHGDPDLQMVLQQLHAQGRRVGLVVHGHMHHRVKGGGWRQMVQVDPVTCTVFLNAATVPRVVPLPHSRGSAGASRHHFLVVDLLDGVPCCAADVWVQTSQHTPTNSPKSSSSPPQDPAVEAQQRSFLAATASAMHAVQHSKSKSKTQKQAAAVRTHEEVRRRVQVQAPQQVSLRPQQQQSQEEGVKVVGGYQVHIAEVYEVLRSISGAPAAESAAAADGSTNGSGAVAGSSSSSTIQGWQYFDAHAGRWVTAPAAKAGAVMPTQSAVGSRNAAS